MRANQPCTHLFAILEGQIEVLVNRKVVTTIGKNSVFGEESMMKTNI